MAGRYNRKDHYYQRAKSEGYRSRAAYKLAELDKKYRILRRGMRVLDLGAAPGSWLQVALSSVGPDGTVVGVDLNNIAPLEVDGSSAVLLCGDARDSVIQEGIIEALQGGADVVLSDMSPPLSGIKTRDAVRSAELVEIAFEIAQNLLKNKGTFVAKIFPSQECDELAKELKPRFARFARPVLGTSRKSSKELYLVGTGFRKDN